MAKVSREEALAVAWVESLIERKITQRNVTKRVRTLGDYLRWCKANKILPLDATHEQLQLFITRHMWVWHGRRNGPDKQRDEIKCLRGWFRWMSERNLVRENPTTHLKVVDKASGGSSRIESKPLRRGPDQGFRRRMVRS